MVRIFACHAKGCEFESRLDRLKLNNMEMSTQILKISLRLFNTVPWELTKEQREIVLDTYYDNY